MEAVPIGNNRWTSWIRREKDYIGDSSDGISKSEVNLKHWNISLRAYKILMLRKRSLACILWDHSWYCSNIKRNRFRRTGFLGFVAPSSTGAYRLGRKRSFGLAQTLLPLPWHFWNLILVEDLGLPEDPKVQQLSVCSFRRNIHFVWWLSRPDFGTGCRFGTVGSETSIAGTTVRMEDFIVCAIRYFYIISVIDGCNFMSSLGASTGATVESN